MELNNAPEFIIVDLFCGAGGTTTGFAMSNGIAKVIACVNHDKNAIVSHWQNHPDVKHFEEDIRTLDLTELVALVNNYRKLYPNAKLILWASLECTNFSKAKGGQPRDADSRTLADHLIRYIQALNPEIVQIENVVEFMSWGPLDENGKPVSRKNGSDWMRWRKEICSIGYVDEWKQLNAADFGAYTSRNRLFGMFSKDHNIIFWPEPTHFKNPSTGNMFDAPKKWKPVREVLDLEDEGKTIFERKKNLSEKTLDRIYAGLMKYVANGDNTFLAKYYGNGDNIQSINAPAGTIPTKDRFSKLHAVWLDRNFTGGGQHSSIDSPAGSILSIPKLNMVQAEFILNKNSSTAPSVSLNVPSPTITQRTHYVVKAQPFLMNTAFNNVGKDIDSPAPVLTASRRHHYLINPQWGAKGGLSVDKPCFTLIARMDKAPPSIITVKDGEVSIHLYESDSTATIKIKKFMAAFGIIDVKMRMLKVPELLKIQGFPNNYKLHGTQTDQKKFIGNSVCPDVVRAWIISIANNQIKIAA